MLSFYKRAISLSALSCLFTMAAFAQRPLTSSKEHSYYTYIYKLTTAQVARFYTHPDDSLNENILHHPIDSFKTNTRWENTLPAGNYLKVAADKNRLTYALLENHSAFIKVLHNDYDHRFIIWDKQGNTIKNAAVLYNGKTLNYDSKSGTWHSKNTEKASTIQVDFNGVANFFTLKEEDYEPDNDKISWLSSFWKSIKNIFSKGNDDNSRDRYQQHAQKPKPYYSFVIFNKPRYKPNDTLRFKAFILYSKSKLPIVQKKLDVLLCEGSYTSRGKKIGTVNSYRPGGFEYSFVLGDSIRLDQYYNIALIDPEYKRAKKDAEQEESLYNDPAVVAYGGFKYEEYELKSTKFNLRTDKKEHWRGNPLAIYLKATDENDLPVPDGRVTLTLTNSSASAYNEKNVFVPDTLWTKQIALDPVGETKIMLPDSIFPSANISYQLNARFLNSANEERTQYKYLNFNNKRFNINTGLTADTLKAQLQELGKQLKGTAIISAFDGNEDTISKVKVNLPANIIINPAAYSYNIEADSTDTDVELKDFNGGISLESDRTADSIFVKVINDRKLHFWYSVFAGNKLIDAGEADNLTYKKAYQGQNMVTFWVNYIWGGINHSEQARLLYRKDLLTINVKQPTTVYPGQRVTTDIVVTDNAGKPVANADITAWSLTGKFEGYRAPTLPYLGYKFKYRKTLKPFDTEKTDAGGSNKLNWQRWSKEMGLDSIEYYKFTNPKKMYTIEEQGIDTITQIAPFVVKNGNIEPVHILYIDEKPVYFSQAQQLHRYSFEVSAGRHQLRFRTNNRNFRVDSIIVARGKKLILSVNENAFGGDKVTDTLSTYEANLLNNYFVTIVNNFDHKMALVSQDKLLYYLNPASENRSQILTGPFPSNFVTLDVKTQEPKTFVAEPGFSYQFEPGLLKQKSVPGKYPFNPIISGATTTTDYTQYVLTWHAADSLWQNYLDNRANTTELFRNNFEPDGETGKLIIEREVRKEEIPVLIRNIIIYRYNEPDFLRIFPGNSTNLGQLKKGKYRVMFLMQGGRYDILENVNIKPYGTNFYKVYITPTHPRDSVSIKIINIVDSRPDNRYYGGLNQDDDATKIKEAFNDKYTPVSNYQNIMTGVVVDKKDKSPLPGVSVRIKGTTTGTVTNAQGRFMLKVPANGKLVFNYIGYESDEISITAGSEVSVALAASAKYLQEVVVIGYGAQSKRELTGSVSVVKAGYLNMPSTNLSNALAGRVAGVQVVNTGTPGSTDKIFIRGTASPAGGSPLYIVDGEIVTNIAGINVNDINDLNILKSSAAEALYGARAANGVIIITTKKKNQDATAPSQAQQTEQTLRKNFTDYAYWQPKLTTDAQGKVSFTATFPDDITNWRTFIAGVTDHKQTGFIENQIKSFKPLSANFIAPQFAVAGDEMKLIGKVLNYNATPATLTRTFTYNGRQLKQDVLLVDNSKIDTLNIIASATDSLAFEYTLKQDKGYFDGEERKVPVIKQGVEETKGIFEALNSDTTVNLKFDAAMGPVTFRAEASVLPTLIEESRKLREYKYLCNEQLASKLKGLLAERRIKKFLGEEFKYDKNIKAVIKKLQENRKTNGTWGWWKDTDEELWISLHAVEALLDAQKEGYAVQLDQQKLIDYLVYQLESYRGADKLTCLELLHKLQAKVDYAKYAGLVEKEYKVVKLNAGFALSNYDKLRLMLIKQETGTTIKLDSLLAKERHTLFGNVYWGEDSYRFFDNSIQLSVLAYHIIKNDGKHPELLQKIRGYFLEQRGHGDWRNTYESALILETILPDLLVNNKPIKPASITLKGQKNETITQFPYSAKLDAGNLSISKTGDLPVYITGYQQFWNAKPEKVSKDFTVNTRFEHQGKKTNQLKGGEVVNLQAEVTAKGDADFVMIEVPIPAGCSYESKEQNWTNNEVHREYFKEKVSIFCRKLKQGTYTFSINLIPRYDGKYTLNPAKAEMMYFPVFYGREGMKSVVIASH
ncbi:carboxypeptidase-like regulatory domain-containing protein [Mucilaginibacter flavus]|uniref:carboxypeptidase-like regulatory domain-containing protein n=1 Tax=Mucilaginibacter flavus TaxID=931504 RepID=UPI0025B36645|nr:carboxypeptidase-like regulatory domain-containing protein [Mucilaginibacter flavus]MDN3580259.1 carboxypeptidase-like regulatory domain-containing protein [Mucilaginibacter flavus]